MVLVLVVDDEFLVRMGGVQFVKQAGYRVIEAADADEAIRILESRSDIDIVFSDVTMPGSMDGLRLLQLIRDRWPPIRLILTSGKALVTPCDMPRGSVFLPKPYAFETVARALQQAA